MTLFVYSWLKKILKGIQKLKILTLGSSGGAPTKRRNCSSFILHTETYSIMFDCGEGTQRQLLRAGFKLSKIKYIFISHMHSDHVAGLMPMLATKSMFNIPGDITIIGPKELDNYIKLNLNITNSNLGYNYKFIELKDGLIKKFRNDKFQFKTHILNHRIDSFGFRLKFEDRPGNLIKEKLDKYGITEGPICGELQRGKTVITDNGKKVNLEDVAGPKKIGKIFTYIPDTYLCDNINVLSKNTDVLYIESTFQKEHDDRALNRFHLTSYHCGIIANDNNVGKLILFHFSASYTNYQQFIDDANENYTSEVLLAKDLEEYQL